MKRRWGSCFFTWQTRPQRLSWPGSQVPGSTVPGEWWASCLCVSCLSSRILSQALHLDWRGKRKGGWEGVEARSCWLAVLALASAGAEPAGVVKGRARNPWGKQWQQVLLSGVREQGNQQIWPGNHKGSQPLCLTWVPPSSLVSLQACKCSTQLHQTPGVCRREPDN